MTPEHNHVLFTRYPLNGRVPLSTGSAPTPYHVYDGIMLLIGGTVDLSKVRELIDHETVTPIATRTDRALMAIWIADFATASLGPHHELQFSLLVSHHPMAPVRAHRLALLRLLALEPGAGMLCHGLWNDEAPVVAYNSEYLGLRARLAASTIRETAGRVVFSFNDERTGSRLISGALHHSGIPAPGPLLALLRVFGPGGMVRFMRAPHLTTTVINRIGDVMPRNADAAAFTAYDRVTLQWFDPAVDRLTINHGTYAALDFQPQFVQQMQGVKFVYLHPDQSAPQEAASGQ
jgi:hypothetical protein